MTITPASATPAASTVVKSRSDGTIDPNWIGVLSTPAAIALVDVTYVDIASFLCDDYASRAGRLQLTKTDGSVITRQFVISHNGTSAADATTIAVESNGTGTHADFDMAGNDWLDAALELSGVTQLAVLQIKATANGTSWQARVVFDVLKAPTA